MISWNQVAARGQGREAPPRAREPPNPGVLSGGSEGGGGGQLGQLLEE